MNIYSKGENMNHATYNLLNMRKRLNKLNEKRNAMINKKLYYYFGMMKTVNHLINDLNSCKIGLTRL